MPIVLLGIFVPRLTILILYFFTGWFDNVFTTWLWPLLGFIFMPYSLLWYTVVYNWFGGTWGALQIAAMAVAVIIDLASLNGSRRR
jgi:hypothetical protein